MMWIALLAGTQLSWADPFRIWDGHTGGDDFGGTYGISVADVDNDGWVDVLAPYQTVVWLNLAGVDWAPVPVPDLEIGGWGVQYGASFGDYDRDRMPDLSSEPRGDRVRLLHNEGGGLFQRLDGLHFPAEEDLSAETNGWVDVDGDGWIDLFVPAYYGLSGLWMNQGPDAAGDHSFIEVGQMVGIELSPTVAFRPEGAQYLDLDRDGDADLFVCGQMLHNQSTPGDVWFEAHKESGIGYAFDEGAAFADIDMDGDFDLGVLYHDITFGHGLPLQGMILWQNQGDATFRMLPPDTVQDMDITGGYNLGMSFADWDGDGDPDLTFSDRFERNDRIEIGDALFTRIDTVAGLTNATPGWFDWDKDGDLDIALGVWSGSGVLAENMLYDKIPPADRRVLRVRPAIPSPKFAQGVDTEFGATVAVRERGDEPGFHHRQFTASGHGYLNQSEYTLTFGLDRAAAPVVDVAVDFTHPGDQGVWRVDGANNPALRDVDVLALEDREVSVFRDGWVTLDGVDHAPDDAESFLLQTPGGIALPPADATPSVATEWVGLELEVGAVDVELGAVVREVLVEGQLAPAVDCGGEQGNLFLWDMGAGVPEQVGAAVGAVDAQNRRVEVATDFVLQAGGVYRIVARVATTRTFEPMATPPMHLTVSGALSGPLADVCDGASIAAAVAVDGPRALAVRFRERVIPLVVGTDTGDTGLVTTPTTPTTPPDTGTATEPTTSTGTTTGGTTSGTEPTTPGGDGDDTGAGDKSGDEEGCGCAASPSPLGLWAWVPLALFIRRRRRAALR
jgi:hypothetical protein